MGEDPRASLWTGVGSFRDTRPWKWGMGSSTGWHKTILLVNKLPSCNEGHSAHDMKSLIYVNSALNRLRHFIVLVIIALYVGFTVHRPRNYVSLLGIIILISLGTIGNIVSQRWMNSIFVWSGSKYPHRVGRRPRVERNRLGNHRVDSMDNCLLLVRHSIRACGDRDSMESWLSVLRFSRQRSLEVHAVMFSSSFTPTCSVIWLV